MIEYRVKMLNESRASAAFPFLVCDAILVALLLVFPTIALYLPNLMR